MGNTHNTRQERPPSKVSVVWFVASFFLFLIVVLVFARPLRCLLEYRIKEEHVALAALLGSLLAGCIVKFFPSNALKVALGIFGGAAAVLLAFLVVTLLLPPVSQSDCPSIARKEIASPTARTSTPLPPTSTDSISLEHTPTSATQILTFTPAVTETPTAIPTDTATAIPTKPPTQTSVGIPALPPCTVQKLGKDESDMIFMPGGDFLMGDDDSGFDDEKPQHLVYVPDFWIDKYEVSNGKFAVFIASGGYTTEEHWSDEGWAWLSSNRFNGSNPSDWGDPRFGEDEQPVIGVNWYEVDAYCRWAGKRLPTEAEWEKAARWDFQEERSYAYPWGDSMLDRTRANVCDSSADHTHYESGCTNDFDDGYPWTAPVRSFPNGQSPCGAFNMVGNVWEWTSDWYKGYPGSLGIPDHTGKSWVLRGASWQWFDVDVRAANRYWAPAPDSMDPNALENVRKTDVGFRCACEHPCEP